MIVASHCCRKIQRSRLAFLVKVLATTALAGLCAGSPASAEYRFNIKDFGAKGDGITDDAPALQAAIEAAILHKGAAIVTVPSGRYLLLLRPGLAKGHIEINGADGLTLQGEAGTLLVGTDPTKHMISIDNSRNVVIRRLKMDRNPLVFTQGVIESIDPEKKVVNVIIDPGFEAPDSRYIAPLKSLFVFTEPESGSWDHKLRWPPTIVSRQAASAGRWRLTLNILPPSDFVGKRFFLWDNVYKGWGVSIQRSRDVLVEDVAYYGGGADAGFLVGKSTGTITFHRFSVGVPPGSHRLFAASGGSMAFGNRARIVMDDCDISKVDDDGFNMGTTFAHVLAKLSPRSIRVEDTPRYQVGDTIALWDWIAKKERVEAKLTSVLCNEDDRSCDLVLDKHVDIARVGKASADRATNENDGLDRVVDFDDAGSAVIKNSRFQNYRARCILMKASNSLIEGNYFYDTPMAAILVGPEFYWGEGPPVHNLVIRNNHFRNISGSNIFVGSHRSETSYDNHHIVIEGNTFDSYGEYDFGVAGKRGTAIYVRNTDGGTIRNNVLGAASYGVGNTDPILIESSRRIDVEGNTTPKN